MSPTYGPTVGYHPEGYTVVDGELNPHTIATIDLVPASRRGAMEVGGPSLHEHHGIASKTVAVTGAQNGVSTNDPALITHVDPDDTERRSGISITTSPSTFQSRSGGMTGNARMRRGSAGRRGLPAEEFEADMSRLADRLIIQGVDRAVVELCSMIFAQGVSLEALKARMTRKECEKHGLRSGMRYRMLLDIVKMTKGGVSMNRHACRLCPRGEAADYRNHRDALRHLLRDHFGMGFQCTQWSASLSPFGLSTTNTQASSKQTFWTANELNRHAAIKHAGIRK
jgi:hypothetical protein